MELKEGIYIKFKSNFIVGEIVKNLPDVKRLYTARGTIVEGPLVPFREYYIPTEGMVAERVISLGKELSEVCEWSVIKHNVVRELKVKIPYRDISDELKSKIVKAIENSFTTNGLTTNYLLAIEFEKQPKVDTRNLKKRSKKACEKPVITEKPLEAEKPKSSETDEGWIKIEGDTKNIKDIIISSVSVAYSLGYAEASRIVTNFGNSPMIFYRDITSLRFICDTVLGFAKGHLLKNIVITRSWTD